MGGYRGGGAFHSSGPQVLFYLHSDCVVLFLDHVFKGAIAPGACSFTPCARHRKFVNLCFIEEVFPFLVVLVLVIVQLPFLEAHFGLFCPRCVQNLDIVALVMRI